MNPNQIDTELSKLASRNMIRKIRVMENGQSYEDYSISIPLTGNMIPNFTISTEGDNIIIKKKHKNSTRHVMFNQNLNVEITVSTTKKKHIILNVLGPVFYTDGTRRYK